MLDSTWVCSNQGYSSYSSTPCCPVSPVVSPILPEDLTTGSTGDTGNDLMRGNWRALSGLNWLGMRVHAQGRHRPANAERAQPGTRCRDWPAALSPDDHDLSRCRERPDEKCGPGVALDLPSSVAQIKDETGRQVNYAKLLNLDRQLRIVPQKIDYAPWKPMPGSGSRRVGFSD